MCVRLVRALTDAHVRACVCAKRPPSPACSQRPGLMTRSCVLLVLS